METIIIHGTEWKLTEFIGELTKFNDAYRKGDPLISDRQYDALIDALKSQYPDHDWFWRIEPASVDEDRKVKLPVKMRSLNKIKTQEEFDAWVKSCGLLKTHKIVCMPKLDGGSLLVEEPTAKGYTRGGEDNEGQICDQHLLRAGIKTNDKFQYTFGEFIIRKDSWAANFEGKLNPKNNKPYKSPRNVAVGMLNAPIPPATIPHATFFRYGVSGWSPEYRTFTELIADICDTYGQEPLFKTITISEWSHNAMQQLYSEWSNIYGLDGIVVYVDDMEISDKLGRHSSTGNPLYAIAYKGGFEEVTITEVLSVTAEVSKNGYLRPTVQIEPVALANSTIDNPTGNNMKFVLNNNIAEGAMVEVMRSGEVIPKIIGVKTPATTTSITALIDRMRICPSCGNETKWNDTATDIMCVNPDCSGIRFAKLFHFFNTIGCFGVGEEIYKKLFNSGFDTVKKILDLTVTDICSIEGLGVGKARDILETNQKIKKGVDFDTIMHASDCFELIGKKKAAGLLNKYDVSNTNHLCGILLTMSTSTLEQSKTDQAFFYGIPKFLDFISDNELVVNDFSLEFEVNENGVFAGVNVCFSGVRDKDLEEYIVAEGGSVCSGVTKKTTHLVVKDKNQSTSKTAKARDLKITICTLDEFRSMF